MSLLVEYLFELLDSVYFVNSGIEVIEGVMKLVKCYIGRYEFVVVWWLYYGSS